MEDNKSDLFLVHSMKRLTFFVVVIIIFSMVVAVKIYMLMVTGAGEYGEMAILVQERERSIKARRGIIYDRNGVCLASNKPVCSISVIHNQITEPERVIEVLSSRLDMDEAEIRKRVEKVSSREK